MIWNSVLEEFLFLFLIDHSFAYHMCSRCPCFQLGFNPFLSPVKVPRNPDLSESIRVPDDLKDASGPYRHNSRLNTNRASEN
jgi:hypothetical protein